MSYYSTSQTAQSAGRVYPSPSYPPPPTPGAPRMKCIPLPPVEPQYAPAMIARTSRTEPQYYKASAPDRSTLTPPPSPRPRYPPSAPYLRTIPLPKG